ncbi:hypothetical protein [Candidatus Phytoplasma melaleucae]|uniref:Uncharacterized protein n=1 Tax=Candidatus Phytoplasma melaleucae TaxID=2982630 RepID=A0ABT9DFG6_9MOLU|nr:hypothetical protein ['Melaleuca sp.' phytoplasma]MDO8168025.1 hypothetical protein ['Melaleuca sp.' phytoplasma]
MGVLLLKKNEPFDYYEASKFYPQFKPEDKIKLYSVFGGIPTYLEKIDPSKAFQQNVIQVALSNYN